MIPGFGRDVRSWWNVPRCIKPWDPLVHNAPKRCKFQEFLPQSHHPWGWVAQSPRARQLQSSPHSAAWRHDVCCLLKRPHMDVNQKCFFVGSVNTQLFCLWLNPHFPWWTHGLLCFESWTLVCVGWTLMISNAWEWFITLYKASHSTFLLCDMSAGTTQDSYIQFYVS